MVLWAQISWIAYLNYRYDVYLLPGFVCDLRDSDYSEQRDDTGHLFCTLTYRKSLSDSNSGVFFLEERMIITFRLLVVRLAFGVTASRILHPHFPVSLALPGHPQMPKDTQGPPGPPHSPSDPPIGRHERRSYQQPRSDFGD